jgi:hypothetical protein
MKAAQEEARKFTALRRSKEEATDKIQAALTSSMNEANRKA